MNKQSGESVRVIVTRSSRGNEEIRSKLESYGLVAVELNTLSFLPPSHWSIVDMHLANLDSFDWLVFTSATGVDFFVSRMNKLSHETNRVNGPFVAAVGERTADALGERGIRVDFVPSRYSTETLARELPAAPGSSMLLLRADIADQTLDRILRERGLRVTKTAIYRTVHSTLNLDAANLRDCDAIVFASPSAVKSFCIQIDEDTLRTVTWSMPAACIGPVTAKEARESGFQRLIVPKIHTLDALLAEVRRTIQNA